MNVLSRAWLLSEAPTSRAHAGWVRRYRGWLQFRANGLAMVGLITVLVMIAASLAAPLIAPQDPTAQDLAERLEPPSAAHWLGTDELGRDLFSRAALRRADHAGHGGRAGDAGRARSASRSAASRAISAAFVDAALMRVTDVFLAFPRLILALAFVAALGPGITSAIIAIALTAWPPYARLARADTLTVRAQPTSSPRRG